VVPLPPRANCRVLFYTLDLRRLIINADDFGLTQGVNRAIVESHAAGIVTSTTLMANAPASHEAVGLAQKSAGLSVGCHVVLIGGEPVLPAQDVTSLAQKSGAAGSRFRDGLSGFAARALAGRLAAEEIEAEATAQIRKIQAEGISLSHFDTHKHTHMFPAVLRPLLRAAENCGVKAVRNPFPAPSALPAAMLLAAPLLWTRQVELKVLRRFASSFRRAVDEAGLRTTDGSLGVLVTGSLDQKMFRAIVEKISEGTWEFVCHPGYNDADLQSAGTRLKESREQELRILTSPESKRILSERGIELISYNDLLVSP
jgi:chitin disaccharide deacetylase